MKKISSTILLSAICLSVFSQNNRNLYGFEKSNSIPVSTNSKSFPNAWAGGINSAQVNTLDLNMDGTEDLVLFDKQGKNFHTYIAVGSGSNMHYEYAPEFEKAFPELNFNAAWALLRDYNCDGKKDLFFADGGSYFSVWENTSGSTLSFTPANGGQKIQSTYSNINTSNLYVNSANLPGIIDIDNDGAIDLLTYVNNGIEMEYHKGQTPCGLDFALEETCWGHFTETGFTKAVDLNNCTPRKKKTMHNGSAILPLDLNGDQIKDLILGNVSFSSMTAVVNGGSLDSAHMVSQDTLYPASNPINVPHFPAAYYEDVDFDGKPDLLVSPSVTTPEGVNMKSLYYYKNTGSTSVPSFSFQQDDFLQESMIDIGERSVPRLVDLTGDGLPDLVVSNSSFRLRDSADVHAYFYFENTGTISQPAFTLVDSNFMDIASYGINPGSIPAFGDLDGDGDLDAIVGTQDGVLHYFTNSSSSVPNLTLATAGLQSIDVGNNAAPFLYDLDSNGTLDLFVGNALGKIYYYTNSSTSSPNFAIQDQNFGGVDVSGGNTYGYSIPYLFKRNGLSNLFVGSYNLGVQQFDSLKQVTSTPSVMQPIMGNGNIASTSTQETPLGINEKNGRNQVLITLQEMRDAGLVFGYINGISLKVTTSANNYVEHLYIRIKESNDTSLNSFHTDFTTALSDYRPGLAQGWNYLEFSDPFLWNGNSGIIIEFCFRGQPKSNNIHVEMTDVGFNANAYGDYVDPTLQGDGCAQPYLGSTSLRPNIRLLLRPAFSNTENYGSGIYSAPAVADLDNDGYLDMILGGMNGGLSYYSGKVYDVGIEEPEYKGVSNLIVYPNPGTGRFVISTPYTGNAEIFVFDLSGRQIFSAPVFESETEVNLEKQPSGMYLFIYKSNETLKTGKVIKR